MTITTERDPYEGARENAKGALEEILGSYRAYMAGDGPGLSGDDNREAIEERMREGVLSVQVRSGWREPGDADHCGNVEYEILLATGGPALRVYGELNGYGEPEGAELQMQDWGVPWREVWPCEVEEMDEAREALRWFAGLFWYGE